MTVNNRAFAGHHEQAGWTLDTLGQRMRQPWFDADDLRLHERDGRLAAFCWTKRHDAALYEIYIIGVDPDLPGTRTRHAVDARRTRSHGLPRGVGGVALRRRREL